MNKKRGRDSSPPKGASTEGEGAAPSPSSLRTGRFGVRKEDGKGKGSGTAGSNAKEKRVGMVEESHNHRYKRVHVDGKVKLKSPPEEEDKLADEFVRMVINLINNAKTVDSNFVLVSRVEGKHPWISLASQVDYNHAILGRHVTTASNVEFKRQKPWGNIRSCDDDGLINPSAAFTLAWNCDVPPADIIDGIRTEFQKVGGSF